MKNPPCWPDGQPPPNRCAATLFQRVTSGNTELHGEWTGWRIAGRELITPQRRRVPVAVLLQLIEMHYMRLHFDRQGIQPAPVAMLHQKAVRQDADGVTRSSNESEISDSEITRAGAVGVQ